MKSWAFILVILICLSDAVKLKAQVNEQPFPCSQTMPASSDLEDIFKRKLLVVIVEPDSKMLNHLSSKPVLYKAYVNGIAACNNNLREVINKEWKVGSVVEYKTIKEIEGISNKSDYAVAFLFMTERSTKKPPTYEIPLSFSKDMLENDTLINQDCYKNKSVQLGISFLNDNIMVFSKVQHDIFPTKTDLMVTINLLTSQYKKDSTVSPSIDNVKNKTLLIRNDMLDPQFITEDDIKKNSPFHYKMVSRDELDEYVMAGDTNYVFVYFDDDYFAGTAYVQGHTWAKPMFQDFNRPAPPTDIHSGYFGTINYHVAKRIMGIRSNSSFYFIAESQEKYQRLVKQLIIQPEDFKSWSGFIKR